MSDFQKDLQIGKVGECAVASYMATRNHKVEDVSDNKDFWSKDIDFILTNVDGQKCTLEVKSDKKIDSKGNFFIEEENERQYGSCKGWYHYCEADYICFYDYTTGHGYVVDWKQAKPQLKQKAQHTCITNWGDGGFTWGYLLSIGVAKREGWIVHQFTYFNEGGKA